MSKKEPNNTSALNMANSYRLPKKLIMRGRDNFNDVFSAPHFFSTPTINGRYIADVSSKSGSMFAFIAPKRLGSAPVRNLLKRRLREAFRLQQHILSSMKSSYKVAFIARKPVVSREEIHHDMEKILVKFATENPTKDTH